MSRELFEQVALPSCRLGFVNPLDVIDTFAYEFYRLAPANTIASMTSVGLQGFSGDAAFDAVNRNLTQCLRKLAQREVSLIMLGGLPMLFNLGQDYLRAYSQRCQDEFGITGVTSIDAVLAAFEALAVREVVVADKWGAELNAKVAATLGNAGVDLVGSVTEEFAAADVQAAFEEGAGVALRLAERARKQYPHADCLFIAGGAWLVAPFIRQIEERYGFSVVAGQQSKIWYALNRVGNSVERPEYGRLMGTTTRSVN